MLFNLGTSAYSVVFLFATTSTSSKNQRNHHEAYHRNPTLLSGLFQSCQCRKLGSLLLPRPWSAKLVCDYECLRRL
ncbi:hypothetical protein B0T12DRAFT_426800 [Alternaria alternata]|nr:hypothetical protein B0T12DRAFT_426800 [Alternaria alternata]